MQSPVIDTNNGRNGQSETSVAVISDIRESVCFQTEAAWLARGGFPVADQPRLYKVLENNMVRVVFPTTVTDVDEGTAIGLICLYSLNDKATVYAHAVFAGPTSNASLRSIFNPPNQSKPQPGVEGNKAIVKFVAWKAASWGKFLNEELSMGTAEASRIWLASFWKALDRMYGGGNLLP
ncbi:MAG TPA: hypothetical protein P5081_06515 [Phycisphaerae bacterium]|nr:hypothetical protein [Phycisphaerae bacterium]HRW52523.1 hypothetical protein [Phycisphaerae bacterium]